MSETSSSLPARRMLANELVRGRDLNALDAEVKAISADAGVAVHPEQSQAFANADRRIVRILDKQQNAVDETWSYGWVDVNEQSENGKVQDRPLSPGGNTGNSSSRNYPARERSGNPDVPLGAIVVIEPGQAGSYYVFDYPWTGHWFEILSGAGPVYSCREQYHAGGTTWNDLIDPYTGTTITVNVREIHGVTGLVAGTIVRAWHGFATAAPQVVIRRDTLGDSDATNEVHSLYIKGAVSGTYALTFEGVGPTSALAYNHNAAALETALEALANLTAVTVTGSGTEATPYLIEYLDDFAPHHPADLVADIGLLKGDQEWLCSELYGGNVTFNSITVGSIISTLFQGVKQARVTVTSFGAGYTRTGNNYEATANGALGTQDGQTMVVGDRLLLRNGVDSGVLEITSLGSAGSKFTLIRASDADESTEMVSGTLVYVRAGTTYADTLWRLVTEPPIVLNTDSLDFRLLAPQGVRLLAQEIYGRGSIRFISGTGATVTVADDAANDEVEVTIDGPTMAIGSSGTIPNWSAYTLNIPNASVGSGSRGLITDATQTLAGKKIFQNFIQTAIVYFTADAFTSIGGTQNVIVCGCANTVDPARQAAWRLINPAAGDADFPNGGFVLSAVDAGYLQTVYAIEGTGSTFFKGKWGTDSIGNVFSGGICTTVGASGGFTGTL